MNKILKLISSVFIALLATLSISKAEVKVVASIKPIHSLVSYVMDGVGKPDVIVDGYNSPHGFSLKPSHAKMIENADLIIWVGEDLEAFLEKPLDTISKKFAEKDVLPRPSHWGGYTVKPYQIEFWQGRKSRLHDRFRYTLTELNPPIWVLQRLAP